MKNAPTTKSSESAPNKRKYTTGTLPERLNTVRAAVLAALLDGDTLTGMDSVFQHSTTRLSAVIGALETRYGWHIPRHDVEVDTKDGRHTKVTAYFFSQTTIQQSFELGAREWVTKVKIARAKLKSNAKSKQEAAQEKEIRAQLRRQDLRQRSLWGDA